jgi:hypothetical protein
VIDDTYNCQRRLSKKQSEYPDDCGTWDSKKNVTGIFALFFGQATLTIICVINHKKKTFSLMPGGMYCPIGFCR